MSRRKTVKLNLEVVLPLIKEKCRSNVVFCEKMGRPTQKTWVTDWNRKDENGNPKPKNLPSPEEAARMCVLLQTTPEEILVKQDEIDLVKGLLENDPGIKKAPATEGEGYTDLQKAAIQFVLSLPPEKLERFIKMGRAAFEEDK